jgi:hypothetical protein
LLKSKKDLPGFSPQEGLKKNILNAINDTIHLASFALQVQKEFKTHLVLLNVLPILNQSITTPCQSSIYTILSSSQAKIST